MSKKKGRRGHGEGTILQRSDGRWAAAVDLGWVNGRRSRKWVYAPTQKEALEKLDDARRQHQLGLPVLQEKVTVKQYLTGWLQESVKRRNRPSTYASYEHLVRNHIIPALGHVRLARLSTLQLRTMLNQKVDSGLSARTVQYLHAILRKALNEAVKDQLILRNVATLVDPPRVAAKEVTPLTPDEARRFLNAIKGDRMEALFTVAGSLGLRQGEALALRWRDMDLEAGKLLVRYALHRFNPRPKRLEKGGGDSGENEGTRKQRGPTEIHLTEPKTRKSRRTVDLPGVTRTALVAHRERQVKERNLCGSKWRTPKVYCERKVEEVGDFVFTTPLGTPLDGCNVTKRFQKILKDAGVPQHRFHDLRHTAATLLAVQGVHPKAIPGVLGWDQGSMLDRYAHFVDAMRQDAAEKMEAILNPLDVKLAVKEPTHPA